VFTPLDAEEVRTMKERSIVALAAVALLGWAATAGADELYGYQGTSARGPQFNAPRPTATGLPPFTLLFNILLPYQVQSFQVNKTTTCSVSGATGGVGFLYIYEGDFNPLVPLQFLIRTADSGDIGAGTMRVPNFPAHVGTPYFVVTSAVVGQPLTGVNFQNSVVCDDSGLSPALVISHGDCISVQNNTQTCLTPRGSSQSRFRASATFTTAPGQTPVAAQVATYGSGDSALFTFFEPENWELLIKVLNFCDQPGQNAYRLFAAGTTTVGVTVTVVDQVRGGTATITNALNSSFQNQVVPIPDSCP
jgi:hypothetical protein